MRYDNPPDPIKPPLFLAGAAASPYLDAEEARAYLRLPTKMALYALTSRHRLAFMKSGRRLLFTKSDLDAYVLRTRVPANDTNSKTKAEVTP